MGQNSKRTRHKRTVAQPEAEVKLHSGIVKLRCADGTFECASLVTESGKFALHLSRGVGGWSVTHIPSGFAIVQAYDKYKAKSVTAFLEKNWEHWKFRSPKRITPEARIDFLKIARGEL